MDPPVWLGRLRRAAFAIVLLVFGPGTAAAHLQGYGFAHANQPSTPAYSAPLVDSYNDGGGSIDITRSGPGAYAVSFEDLSDVGSGGGHVQVSSTDPGSRYCTISSWGSTVANVRCYDFLGNLADGRFNVLVLRPGPEPSDYAFAWASNPTSASYTPSATYRYNPAGTGSATVTRHQVGHYSIRFDDFDAVGAGPRVDLVTAYGGNARCQVHGAISDGFNVRCHSPLGFAIDSRFAALSMRTELEDDGWGFARVSDPYSFGYTLPFDDGHNAGLPDDPTVDHSAVGVWHLEWPGLDAIGINLGSVQVSADAFFDRQCGVDPEDGDSVTIRCFDGIGMPAETEFQVLFLKPPLKAWLRDFSFAFANDNISGPFPYSASDDVSRNAVRGSPINIDRISTGVYHVEFVGTDEFSTAGHVQVSAFGFNANHCNVETSYDEWAEIRCFNRLGSLTNTHFNVFQAKPSAAEDSIAYARADLNYLSAYTANPTHAYNPGGGAVTVTRTATGVFDVQFPGFGAIGDDGGNAQVSAFGLTNGKCQVASWGSERVTVRCFTTTGNPANLNFNVMLSHADANDEALAYVWASSSTASSYTPSTFYAYQTGTGAITATRGGTGSYTVNFEGFGDEGLGSGIPLVSTHGSAAGICNPVFWTGSTVTVQCYDLGGNAADRRFSLLYPKDFTNTVLEETYVAAPEPGFGVGLVVGAFALSASRRRRR
ncbi:MAG: hypothetical protein NXI30_04135 [bacterium]|nr:hypothetical protein [bacterium]